MAPDVRPAVLFDLFGTLVPGGTRDQRDSVSRSVAIELGVAPDAFAQLVRDTFDDRTTGRLGGLTATIRELASRLGADPSAAAIARAVQLRLALNRSLFHGSWALPVLDRLRSRHVLIGVVSDCSAETPEVWEEGPLAARVDATAFSCLLGVRKPDPAIYLAATNALSVRPEECVFVGDGASNELSGARALGMRAIWYDDLGAQPTDRPNAEVAWRGERINNLNDLGDMLGF